MLQSAQKSSLLLWKSRVRRDGIENQEAASAGLGSWLQVLTAISNVENSKASVELARTARDLAQKRFEAEQKKYELGIDQIFFVLAAQADLTTAESALVRETINHHRNQLTLLERLGTLLEERGIAVQ